MNKAFAQALSTKLQEVVEMIYGTHPQAVDGGDLIVHVARGDGDQYLRDSEQIDPTLVDDALLCATQCERVDILDFLLETGLVTSQMYDKSFVCAARFGHIRSVEFLFKARRYSSWTLEASFKNAASLEVTKFFYDNAYLLLECVVSAFKSAIGLESRDLGNPDETDCTAIAEFLATERFIPPEVINDAFRMAVNKNYLGVVHRMHGDNRLDNDVVINSFVTALNNGYCDMVQAVFDDKHVPQELIDDHFVSAAGHGRTSIVKFLLENSNIPGTSKKDAFVISAAQNRESVVKLLWGKGKWPPKVLRRALSVTTSTTLQRFLREKINADMARRSTRYKAATRK